MFINRLYTLPQFIKLVNKEIKELEGRASVYLNLVEKYGSFLEQPITEDLFLNPVKKECDCLKCGNTGIYHIGGSFGGSTNYEQCDCKYHHEVKYKEAEDKVIFKGFERISSSTIINRDAGIRLRREEDMFYIKGCERINNLYQLAEEGKGMLMIKMTEV